MTGQAAGGGALSFELKNDLTEIATLAETLAGFCEQHGVGHDVASVVSLALEEIVTNIISHSDADGGDRRVWIDLAVDGGDLTARVQDEAPAFDFERNAEALGIHLVKTLMDDVRYSREHDRNVLFIRKATV